MSHTDPQEPVTPAQLEGLQQVKADATKPYKAYAAAVVTALGTFVAFWIGDDDPFTKKEIGTAALASLVASGLTGGVTFRVPNPITKV